MPTADELLGVDVIAALTEVLTRSGARSGARGGPGAWPAVQDSVAGAAGQGLTQRVRLVRDAVLGDLSGGYPELAAVTRAALDDPALTGWMVWPLTEAIAVAATTNPDCFDDGLALLAALTPRLTSEFALRTFLNADHGRTLIAALTWTRDPDPAVRRLASEGTRPRLPWAAQVPAITANPSLTSTILGALHTDPSDVVRRSVANHLNDVSRLDPRLALETARRWSESQEAPTTPAVVRHALRTLVKQADPDALALVGFRSEPGALLVRGPVLRETTVSGGGELHFDLTITNTADTAATVAIDYVIHYRKADGRTAPKVFKLSSRRLAPGAEIAINRRHSFQDRSTRRHHPGMHAVELQVNGQRHGRSDFLLSPAADS